MSKPSRDLSLAERRAERERLRSYYQQHREKIITKQRERYQRMKERKAAQEQSSAAATSAEVRGQFIEDAKARIKDDPLSRWLVLPPSRGFRS